MTTFAGVLAPLLLTAACSFNAQGLPVEPYQDHGPGPDDAAQLPDLLDARADAPPDQGPGKDGAPPDQALPPDHPVAPDQTPAPDKSTGPDTGVCKDLTLKYAGSQYVDAISNTLDLTDNFTVAAWIKPSELNPGAEYQIVSRHAHLLATGYVLLIKQQVPEFRVYHGLLGTVADQSCECKDFATKLTQTNVWVHLAGSFSAGTARLFVDGKLIKSCSCPKQTVVANMGGLRIGACSSCFPINFGFKGLIDDVIVAKTARKAGFDPRQASSLLPCNQVVARWTFAEGSGQSTASLCGGPSGTLGSAPLTADFNDPAWIVGTCLADR